MESVLKAIEQADYADETEVYREHLEQFDDPEEIVVNGETYSVVGISTRFTPTIGITNSRVKDQKGRPDTLYVGLSAEGDILTITTASVRNRIWEEVESIEVGTASS